MQDNILKKAVVDAVESVKSKLDEYIITFPHVSKDNVYKKEQNELWTSSFWPGIVYLAYDYTRDESFLKHADRYMDSFAERLNSGYTDTHDLGFLYTLSSVALYKLRGEKGAYQLALQAAEKLAKRYNEKGKFIRAWETTEMKVDLMIDTMMNLPLLFWAARETNNNYYQEIAVNHALTSLKNLLREDGSTYHIFIMDNMGKPLVGKTFQGKFDESTWARGQAWAIYGFALCYRYTGKSIFLETSRRAADFFINNLPADKIPYWDFYFTDANQDLKDSSAASIAACGLLELATYLGEDGAPYKKAAYEIMTSLYKDYFVHDPYNKRNGFIKHGVYHRDNGADEYTIWGDYFYLEALVRMNSQWSCFW